MTAVQGKMQTRALRRLRIVNKRLDGEQITDVRYFSGTYDHGFQGDTQPDSFRLTIHAEHVHKTGDFFQVPQREAHGFVVPAAHVNEKAVLPRPSAHWSGLNLAQVQVAQGKDTQSLEQRSRNVAQREGQRRLICPGSNSSVLTDQEKACV